MLDETVITRAILDAYFRKLNDHLDVDVAIVGGGPSGLVAGYDLARAGRKVALFESKLSISGGIWGGGMGFNEIVVQDASRSLLEEFGLKPRSCAPGYHTLDSVHVAATLTARAMDAGLTIFNLTAMEDVVVRDGRVAGLVINWSAIQALKWHGGHRMGPVFGGMLLSGRKAAQTMLAGL